MTRHVVQACSASVQATSASVQVKAVAAQVGDRKWQWENKNLVSNHMGICGVLAGAALERWKSVRVIGESIGEVWGSELAGLELGDGGPWET